MTFTWRTGATEDSVHASLSHGAARGLRIGVSVVLAVALVYLFLILKTFRKYGDIMDKRCHEKAISLAEERPYIQTGNRPEFRQPNFSGSRSPSRGRTRVRSRPALDPVDMHAVRSRSPIPMASRPHSAPRSSRRAQSRETRPVRSILATSFDRPFQMEASLFDMTPFPAVKVMDLRSNSSRTYPLPSLLQGRDISLADWSQFTEVRFKPHARIS